MTTVVDEQRKKVLDNLTKYVSDHLKDIPADARNTAGALQKWLLGRRTSHPTDYNTVRAAWRRLETTLKGGAAVAPKAAAPVAAAKFAPVSIAEPVAEAAPVLSVDDAPAVPAPAPVPAPVDITPVMPPPAQAPAPVAPQQSYKPYDNQARQRSSYGK